MSWNHYGFEVDNKTTLAELNRKAQMRQLAKAANGDRHPLTDLIRAFVTRFTVWRSQPATPAPIVDEITKPVLVPNFSQE